MLRFVDVLLARPAADGRHGTRFYLLLILLWHLLLVAMTPVLKHVALAGQVVADWAQAIGERVTGRSLPPLLDWIDLRDEWLLPNLLVDLPVLLIAEALFACLFFALSNRTYRIHGAQFVRCWWRTCLIGTVVIPMITYIFADASIYPHVAARRIFAEAAFLIVTPAWFARRELRQQPVMSRWRPVCPECGYRLRGPMGPRCTECGVDFPSTRKSFRRWAVRRLPWDRLHRPSWPLAYLKSLVLITFTPAIASRGVALPDRWGRCIRWAILHVLTAGAIAALLSNDRAYVELVYQHYHPPAVIHHLAEYPPLPLGRILLWAGHSLLAWTSAIGCAVTLGTLISYFTPRTHRATKLGGVKWSLYQSAMFLPILILWYAYFTVIFPPGTRIRTAAQQWEFTEIPLNVLTVLYGVWWAIGLAASPFGRHRSWFTAIGYVCLFLGSWLLITRVIFAAHPFEDLR